MVNIYSDPRFPCLLNHIIYKNTTKCNIIFCTIQALMWQNVIILQILFQEQFLRRVDSCRAYRCKPQKISDSEHFSPWVPPQEDQKSSGTALCTFRSFWSSGRFQKRPEAPSPLSFSSGPAWKCPHRTGFDCPSRAKGLFCTWQRGRDWQAAPGGWDRAHRPPHRLERPASWHRTDSWDRRTWGGWTRPRCRGQMWWGRAARPAACWKRWQPVWHAGSCGTGCSISTRPERRFPPGTQGRTWRDSSQCQEVSQSSWTTFQQSLLFVKHLQRLCPSANYPTFSPLVLK